MSEKKVVVKGGGNNLYSTSESAGIIYVYKGSGYGRTQLAKVKIFADALSIIENHSGKKIDRIE